VRRISARLIAIAVFVILSQSCFADPGRLSSPADDYRKQIISRLAANKPRLTGADAKLDGTASVFFKLDRQGHLLSSEIKESSGSKVVDDKALTMVRKSQPFPPAPAELDESTLNFGIPVTFHRATAPK
jgi:periplasmic protein TonB